MDFGHSVEIQSKHPLYKALKVKHDIQSLLTIATHLITFTAPFSITSLSTFTTHFQTVYPTLPSTFEIEGQELRDHEHFFHELE